MDYSQLIIRTNTLLTGHRPLYTQCIAYRRIMQISLKTA